MSHALAHTTADLFAFVESTEPSLGAGQPASPGAVAERAETLAESFARVRDDVAREIARLVDETVDNLRALAGTVAEAEVESSALRDQWRRLSANYEALRAHLTRARVAPPDGQRLGRIKPRNWSRNVFHVCNGLLGVLLYELAFGRATMIAIGSTVLGVFVALDVSRRLFPGLNAWYVDKLFGGISRPGEAHETPSSTWYMAGLLFGTIFYPQHGVELGVLILAFGDPVAAQVGKRWGRRKLYRDKSVAGTLAFVLAAMVTGVVFLSLVRPALGWPTTLGIVAAAAVAGAIAELFGDHLEDNFTIPVVAGAVAALLLAV